MSAEAEARVLILYTGGTIGMLKTEGGGYAPHPGFLASSLRSQARFHDPAGDSVWTHSSSAAAFSQWSQSQSETGSGTATPSAPAVPLEHDPSAIAVETSTGTVLLPSLLTPRFAQGKRIRYAVYEYERLIDSSEIEPSDFLAIASDIERNYHHFDGFIILHGTDTMAFSASALSFLLEDLGKTVILTGAQIPLSELFTDAVDNLLGSLIIAGHYHCPEVGLFFDNNLFRGNRSIKFSSANFHAFQSPNLPPLATVGIDVDVAWSQVLRPGPRPFRAHKAFSSDVATLRFFPGITAAAVRAFLRPGGVRGVVLESYGAGNAPRRPELLAAFREATEQGVVLVNVSQCVTGAVAADIYETGRALAASGVIGGGDMTTEAALAKLSYLLSKPDLSPAQIRKLVAQPLRGELTPTSRAPTFSSPADADSRLRTLFSQIVELAPSTRRGPVSPTHRTVALPSESSAALAVPEEFSTAWPTTLADEEALRGAVMPYLLAQAAGRTDGSLQALLASLNGPTPTASQTSTSTSSAPLALPSVLNEPATATLQTPLHLAVLASAQENVALLLSHGASVHARDVFAHSPLFYAAKQGGAHALEVVKALKAAGAHLSEQEIESGKVGLEVLKAEKAADPARQALWEEAATMEELERAKAVLLAVLP
ncbi:hypothetical protein JCM6882_002473 [Rhodosporidiobolus microsporus]